MPDTKLARNLNFTDIYLISLGHIIGAGIFILISKSAKYSKNYTWLAFLIAGLLSVLNAFTYMDLASIFKTNSSEFEYISESLGKPIGLISTILILLMGIFLTATVTLGTGEYMNKLFGFPKILSAILLIVIFAGINIVGVKTSANVNAVTTIIETGALILVIVGGFFYINNKNSKINSSKTTGYIKDLSSNLGGVLYASLIAIFAYTGFETTVKLTEEAINPNRDIPLALITSVITSIVLYTLISYIATKLINVDKFAKSVTPIADMAKIIFGENMYKIFTMVALVSISNTVLSSILGNSRLLHGISGFYPQLNILQSINDTTQTPIIAIITIAFASILALNVKNVEKSSVISSYLFFIILTLVNLSLIIIYLKGDYKTELSKTWSNPINQHFPILPTMAFITSVGMIIFCFSQKKKNIM